MNLNGLNDMSKLSSSTEPMPVLFIGHGSPMNAIEKNIFSIEWSALGASVPVPSAILCISAHWETNGSFVTSMEHPTTIHDFYGFPDKLFSLQYPAPGSLALAKQIRERFAEGKVEADTTWGLDHGCWSILKHVYPDANIPVVQLSLDYNLSPAEHFLLGRQLAGLRRKGILIIGSGNIVHNLRMTNWKNTGQGYDWAIEANEILKEKISDGDHKALQHYSTLGTAVQKAIPTPEHFLPLIYTLGLMDSHDQVSFFNDACIFGSLSMTSLKIFQ